MKNKPLTIYKIYMMNIKLKKKKLKKKNILIYCMKNKILKLIQLNDNKLLIYQNKDITSK